MTNQPWQPPAEWLAVEATAPQAVRTAVDTAEAKLKDRPKHFVGREVELDQIRTMMVETAAAGAGGEGAPEGKVIHGAPGAGKTSLTKEAEDRLRAEGYSILNLKAQDVGDGTLLTNRIRTQQPWSDREWLRNLMPGIRKALTNTGDAFAKGMATYATAHGIRVDTDHLEPMEQAVQAILDNRATTPNSVLRILPHASTKGTMIIIDEAQQLSEHKGTPSENHAREIIRSISTNAERAEAGISHINVIYAGLTDTGQAVADLGSLRLNEGLTNLGPLTEPEQHELIKAYVTDAAHSIAQRDAIVATWSPTLVKRFGEWTHHTHGAAQAAAKIIRAANGNGDDPLSPWGLPGTLALATRYRDSLYHWIVENTQKHRIPANVVRDVAYALLAHGNAINPDELHSIAGRAWREAKETAPERTIPDYDTTWLKLHRCGVLASGDGRRSDGTYGPTTWVPVPSLLRHMTRDDSGRPQGTTLEAPPKTIRKAEPETVQTGNRHKGTNWGMND